MVQKAEYKSALRSRRLIREALLELIQEKDLEKITVTDIIKRADINRGTFYAHYQDLRAVMEQIENEVIDKIEELITAFHYKNFFQNPLPLLLKTAKWLEEDLEFYRILINANGSEKFLVKLREIFVKKIEIDSDIPDHIKKMPEFFIHAHFFAGGIINLFLVWIRGELSSSIEEICAEVSKILTIYSPHLMEEKHRPMS
ncbi:TetR family transcriptional regulator [Clostridium zeae]|uniref:TetR family transcriptional regulator n=1 Tax=Clostridium zeae TaxID=2759022 RepID=A0ABQ1EGB2_9CLOT|nr:TetR/AcrR family transcriptional regulator [Clostridium zeae]GFZ33872.1 TetR family transcriptional regulator [Clostridium zeae]